MTSFRTIFGSIFFTTSMLAPLTASAISAGDFLAAQHARSAGDVENAAEFLGKSVGGGEQDLSILQDSYRTLVMGGRVTEAIPVAEQAITQGDDSVIPRIILAVGHAHEGKYDAAIADLNAAEGAGFYRILLPSMQAWLQAAQGWNEQAASTLDIAKEAGIFSPFIHYQNALLQDVMGNMEAAGEAYDRYREEGGNVTSEHVAALLANFYVRSNQDEKLAKLREEVRNLGHNLWYSPEEVLSFVDNSLKDRPLKPLITSTNEGLAETLYGVGAIAQFQNSNADTLAFLRLALYLRPEYDQGYILLASLFEESEQYDEALKALKHVRKGSFSEWKAGLQRARIYHKQGNTRLALSELDRFAEAHPKSHAAQVSKGDILRTDGEFRKATTEYTAALERIGTPLEEHWPVLFARGICYERLDDWDAAEKDFNKALELRPNQPEVLNYLAYSWLEMNHNIEGARDMLRTALASRPDDPHIMDSYAWAEYRLGNFADAAVFLEKAIELMPNDAVVTDHLGDVYWALGREVEARYQWERALVFKPDDELKAAIEEKLQNGLKAADIPVSQQKSIARKAPAAEAS